ncbi:MAG: type II toxin-antitoxin system Phd/YefM family antitoxin [Ignavibacteriales bacterium]|nr:type II toxin-antitoxin system Phd/YefM family antitoxin [Ignavibacteriales bacterium]
MSVITLPVTEAKQRFTEIVKAAEKYFDRYLVTKNGKEAAVVMSAEEYESLLETLDVLSNKKELRALREGTAEARRKEAVSLQSYLSQKQSPRRMRRRR